MIDEADTHNHSCPECGRDWQHWNGICDYVTSYQIHCPEDFFGKSHESLSASTNRPGLLARLGKNRRISLAAFPVGAAILAMGLFSSLYPSSPLREWSVIFLLFGISSPFGISSHLGHPLRRSGRVYKSSRIGSPSGSTGMGRPSRVVE